MSAVRSQKNGQISVERGGVDLRGRQRSVVRSPEEIRLRDRIQAAYAEIPRPFSRAAEAIKDGMQHPYSSPARRVLEMKAARMPNGKIRELAVGVFAQWVDQVLGDEPPTAPSGSAMPKPMLVTSETEKAA